MQYLARAGHINRWSVFLLFLLTPIFFIPAPWMSMTQSKILLMVLVATIGFIAWVAHTLDTSTIRFPRHPLILAAALIPIAYLISALATGASWESFVGNGRGQDTVIGFVLLYAIFLISARVLGGSRTTTAIRLLYVSSLTLIGVQVAHLAFPSFTFGGVLTVPASSIVGSWHDLGIFLALMVFLTISLLKNSILDGRWKWIAAVVSIAALVLLVIINFKSVWLGLFLLCLFGALFPYRRNLREVLSVYRSMVWWVACMVLALGMYFGGTALQGVLPVPIQILNIDVRPSWQGTFAVGQEVFAEPTQIFFGSGPNSFLREWGIHKPLSVNETEFWNTEFYYGVGFIPTSLVTTGIVGLLAWGAVCLALLWALYSAFRDPQDDAVHFVFLGSALFLTMLHILYVPGPALSILTFLIFGALIAQERSLNRIQEWIVPLTWESWRGKIASGVLIAVGLLVFFGGLQAARALVSDVFVNRAVSQYNTTGDLTKATRSLSWALGFLANNDRAHRAGVELGILQLSALAAENDTSDSTSLALQATLRATIEHGLAAVSIEDKNYQNWLTLARLYGELAGVGIEGAEEQARNAYAEVQKKNPASPLSYLGLAQLELTKSDDAAARKALDAALAVKQTFAPAHFLLSQIDARAGDLAQAQEHAAAVVQLAPQDALGWYNLGTIFYSDKNYHNAAASFERAVSLQSNYANALFFLGLSYYRIDRNEDALRVLEVVKGLNADNPTLLDVMDRIERGESLGSFQ